MVRLNKYLAECGVCSRREADRLIDKGCVEIDGKTAVMGDKVEAGQSVTVRGKAVQPANRKIVLAFYKPAGVTCTEKDKYAKVTVADYVKYPVRVTYAGRLDKDSEGLMLLSNDGDLIQQITRAVNRHEKEYVVKVHKKIDDAFLEKMCQGVFLKELNVTTRTCTAEQLGPYTFRIVLTQGYNRQIRRMCEAFGYTVKQLKRVRIMNIELGNLPYGTYRELTNEELTELYRKAGM